MGGRVAERNWLVVGASGGVGAAVLERLAATADAVQALSRAARTSTPSRGVRWHVGDLNTANPAEVGSPTHVVSAGPLDAFAGYLAKAEWPPGTVVVALSSMSASTKAAGGHRSEREVARRLLDAEQALFARAGHRAWPVVVLRPTLIWGAGDRSITPLLALARRTGALPLPRGATGLRQPVHVADLAQALVRAAQNPDIGPGPWPAPGGEVLAFDEMLARALAVAVPQARLLRVPDGPCRVLEALLLRLPGRIGRVASQSHRTRGDLDVGAAAVWSRLGIQPRGFDPDAASFPALPGSRSGAAS